MAQVLVSGSASADLVGIKAYSVKQFGQRVTSEYLAGFERCFALLAEHPHIGMLHNEIRPAIRSIPNGSHRIYYDVEGDTVMIRRILHKASDIKRWLRKERE